MITVEWITKNSGTLKATTNNIDEFLALWINLNDPVALHSRYFDASNPEIHREKKPMQGTGLRPEPRKGRT